mgnify:CR=1 FL=1
MTLDSGTTAKAAFAYITTNSAACLNGGTVATSANAFTVSAADLDLGRDGQDDASYFNGLIKRVSRWDSRVANASLQTLTT